MQITSKNILSIAQEVILSESKSIEKLIDYLDDNFVSSVNSIFNSKGRLIVSGIGKSAIIAQKMVATFNSTGTPSMFLHASEAVHGDLGMLQKDDIVICISKSGNSPEIKVLVPLLKRFGNSLIAITGNINSFLAKNADFVLDTTVTHEACPNNLAPTNSTTAQLVMGDALAVCLMHLRNFKAEDFAIYHPGGALGKKLLLKVADLLEHKLMPIVKPTDTLQKIIFEISEKRMGVTAVVDANEVIGIITDGDIRRMLSKDVDYKTLTAIEIMTKNPKTINSNQLVADALNILEDNAITQLVVIDNKEYKGIIHLHDILKEGIV